MLQIKDGETPIDYAFLKGYTEIVKILKSFKTSKEDIHINGGTIQSGCDLSAK